MTSERDPWSSVTFPTCPTGKVCYETRSAASKFAKAMHRKHGGSRTRSYRCSECGWFHIGHAPLAMVRGLISRSDVKHFNRLPETRRGA